MRSSRAVLGTTILGLLLLVIAIGWFALRSDGGSADPLAAARTTFPGLQPATGDPSLPGLAALEPRPGTVVQAAGPFDDRFHFDQLGFDGRTVKGRAVVTSDVSDILELEVLAGFYDRRGTLIGTARDTYHHDESTIDANHEGVPSHAHRFSIRVPRELQGRAVAAAVGVPVLVNE